MPMEESLLKRMGCKTISKAPFRSKRMRMKSRLESDAMRRSLVILMRAFAVL